MRLVTICLLLTLGLSAFAQSSLDKIIESGVIRVGVSGHQPPFSVESKTGQLIGFDIELANVIARAMRVELEIVRTPFPQLINKLNTGQIDVIISGMGITARRSRQVSFAGPYIMSGSSILSKSYQYADVVEFEEISPLAKVVVVNGSTNEQLVINRIPNHQRITVDSNEEAIDLVRNGTADIMVTDYSICAYAVLRFQDDQLVMSPQPMTIEPMGIAVPKGDQELQNLMEIYLRSLEQLDYLNQLKEDWFDSPYWLLQLD